MRNSPSRHHQVYTTYHLKGDLTNIQLSFPLSSLYYYISVLQS